MQTRIVAVFVACFVAAVPGAVSAQSPPIEMVLQCLSAVSAPDLRIALRNTGPKDVNLVLGMTLANGRSYHASALFLDVKRRGSDMIEVFAPTDATFSVAGRLDPWILPLPVQSEFSLTRSLGSFGMNLERLTMDRAPMNLRLRLEPLPQYQPKPNDDTLGAGLVHVQSGRLQSAWIRVPEDCKPR